MSASVMEVEAGLYAQDGFNTVISNAALVSEMSAILNPTLYEFGRKCREHVMPNYKKHSIKFYFVAHDFDI